MAHPSLIGMTTLLDPQSFSAAHLSGDGQARLKFLTTSASVKEVVEYRLKKVIYNWSCGIHYAI
jgi:hypothetical protein